MSRIDVKDLNPGEGTTQFGLSGQLGIVNCPNCHGYSYFNMHPPQNLATKKGDWDGEAFCNFCGALLKITFEEEYNADRPYRVFFTVEEVGQDDINGC